MARIGGLKVSDVGLGAWQAGGGAWVVDPAELRRAYEYALDHGINFIDTAEVYGRGRSEEFVGSVIRGRDVVVATKVAGFNWGRAVKSARESARRLGRTPDLLQLHWPPPAYVPLCRSIRRLEEAAEAGLTGEIGLSNFHGRLLEEALQCTKKRELVSDQVEYSPLARAAELDVMPVAARRGMAVIAWSPLAKGAAVGKWGSDPARRLDSSGARAASEAGRRTVEAVKAIAARRGVSPAAVVLAWHRARGAVPIPGVKRLEQAREAVEALSLQLSEGEVAEIDSASRPFLSAGGWPRYFRYVPSLLMRAAFGLARV